jgi:hypothetical protein
VIFLFLINGALMSDNSTEKLSISSVLLNTVFQYLGTRPYQEVFQMIQDIQKEVGPQLPKNQDSNVTTLTPKK